MVRVGQIKIPCHTLHRCLITASSTKVVSDSSAVDVSTAKRRVLGFERYRVPYLPGSFRQASAVEYRIQVAFMVLHPKKAHFHSRDCLVKGHDARSRTVLHRRLHPIADAGRLIGQGAGAGRRGPSLEGAGFREGVRAPWPACFLVHPAALMLLMQGHPGQL